MRITRVVTFRDYFTSCFLRAPLFIVLAYSLLSFSFTQTMAMPLQKVLASQSTAIQDSSPSITPSQPKLPPELRDIGITEHLGQDLSLNELTFKNEAGESVKLGSFFNKKRPVLLTLVYYECPNLCNFMLNGLITSLKSLDWTVGGKFDIVTLSIDPRETAELARNKKESYLKAYGRPEAASGWHFLTGEKDQIRKIASEVGFGFRYDPQDKQYAHSAAIFVITPEGKISRYLYGIEFGIKDLKLALLEAAYGKIGTMVERLLLFCYRYDPQTKRYSIYLTKLMQLGSGVTMILFGGYLFLFWRRQRKGA